MSLITVGLPVYNALPFLEESVESLLRQTDGDFKILAIDDGSTDSGLKYLRSIRDSRLRVVTQPNRGLTFTLNRMLREVDTAWLMRHDADDVASPDRVGATKRAVAQFPNAGMFYAEARYYQNGRSVGTFRTTRATPDKLREITRSGYLLSICHPTVTLNIQKTIALGGYRFDLHIEDIDLWWRMALHYDMHYHPEVVTYFRHNAASVSAAHLEYQSVNTLYVQYLLLSHLHGWSPQDCECIRHDLIKNLDRPKLACRDAMRRANICYGQKAYIASCKHLVKSVLVNPMYFAKRVFYETRSADIAITGESPEQFFSQRNVLWPDSNNPDAASQSGGKMVPSYRKC
jgi:glycosyltransferase involved in cell wall biosynthesis